MNERSKIVDVLTPLELDQVQLSGFVGEKVKLCIENKNLQDEYLKMQRKWRRAMLWKWS